MKMMQLHGRKGRHRRVENIFQKMREAGLEAKGGEYDALLLSYCRAGLFDQALSVFREYKLKTKPSLVAYNMLIDACGKKGMHEEAVRFYVEVMEAGYHPSSVTYTSLIAAVAQGGRYEKAEELYRRMLRDGVKPTSHTFATMINAYSLRGWTKAGHEVCSDVLKSSGGAVNVKVYGAMLNLYVRGGWYSHAADIFNEMQRNNVEPDAAGYGVLISALGEMDNATIAPLAKALEGSQFELCRVAYHIICSPPPVQDSSSGTNPVSEGSLDGLLQPEALEHDSVVQEVSDFLEIYTSAQDDKSNFSFYNAILDALWRRGLKQRAKIMMLKARSLSDQYNCPHFGESVWSLDLRGLSIRAAQVAVYNFLDETVKRAKMRTILTQKVVIKTGGSGTDEDVYVGQGKGTGVVKQVVFNSLIEMGAPFSEGLDQESLMSLQAPFEELVKWVIRHKDLIQLNDSFSPSLSETGL
jgi:pentatricopeptide repeat protein